MYLSGARGVNTEFVFPPTYSGFANNAFTAPDSDHLILPGGKMKNTLRNECHGSQSTRPSPTPR